MSARFGGSITPLLPLFQLATRLVSMVVLAPVQTEQAYAMHVFGELLIFVLVPAQYLSLSTLASTRQFVCLEARCACLLLDVQVPVCCAQCRRSRHIGFPNIYALFSRYFQWWYCRITPGDNDRRSFGVCRYACSF